MEEIIIFAFDLNTCEVIKEMEECLGLPHKDINKMSKWELEEYINQLTLISISRW